MNSNLEKIIDEWNDRDTVSEVFDQGYSEDHTSADTAIYAAAKVIAECKKEIDRQTTENSELRTSYTEVSDRAYKRLSQLRDAEDKIESLTAEVTGNALVFDKIREIAECSQFHPFNADQLRDDIDFIVSELPTKTVSGRQEPEEYKCGLRLVFGDGFKRIAGGTIEGTPAVIVSSDGMGVIGPDGGQKGPHEIESGNELLAMIFEKEGSIDALIHETEKAKRLFHETQCAGCANPESMCDCTDAADSRQPTVGVDLANEPDRVAYSCSRCGGEGTIDHAPYCPTLATVDEKDLG